MKRRDVITKTLIGGSAILAGCSSKSEEGSVPAVHTKKKIRWRLASSFPSSLDTLYGSAVVLADKVRDMTGGNFDIRVYPGGELVPALEVLDSVQKGSIQAGQSASYYYIGKNPALAFDCCVPFGLTARQQAGWLHHGGGLELTRRTFADFNILNFPAGNTGAQMGGWFKREVNGLADMQGLKMRIPGLGGRVMAELGVAVQTLPGGEIYTALERGAIDATEWVGPYDDEKLGFHKVAKYYYYPGWWEPGPTLTALVNQQAWAKLPKAYQEMFSSACQSANLLMLSRYDRLNAVALERLRQGNTQVEFYGDAILKAAQSATADLLADSARADVGFNSLYSAWQDFRQVARGWNQVTELSYSRFSDGA